MSSNEEDRRAATLKLMGDYQTLIGQRRLDEWIELWAEDGVLEFPYAPPGRRRAYKGKADIVAYMKHATGRVASDATREDRLIVPFQRFREKGIRKKSEPARRAF